MKDATDRRRRVGIDLESRLLAACRQAIAEGHWQVADHLLRALEELAGEDRAAGAALERAYLLLADGGDDSRPRH